MARLAGATLRTVAIIILILGVGVVGFVAVSKLDYPTVPSVPEGSGGGQVEPVAGSDIPRVILSEEAARKIGLQTTAVTATTVAGKEQLSIPYSALYYDQAGETWTYVATEPLVFERQSITVVSIEGSVAILSAGPAVNTKVVTAGSAQLFGTEIGVEEE